MGDYAMHLSFRGRDGRLTIAFAERYYQKKILRQLRKCQLVWLFVDDHGFLWHVVPELKAGINGEGISMSFDGSLGHCSAGLYLVACGGKIC